MEGTGASVEIVAGDTPVRLTWLWDVTRGLKSGYTLDDYVQDGLVALYDGIRNVGRTLPHDSAAAKWTDLAAPSRTASIKVCGQRHAHRREVTR